MSFVMKGRTKSNAEAVNEYLKSIHEAEAVENRKKDMIDLYPDQELMNSHFFDSISKQNQLREDATRFMSFKDEVHKELMFHFLENVVFDPIQEQSMMNSHQREVLANAIVDYINENDIYGILDTMESGNIYLNEIASYITEAADNIIVNAEEKKKEGLSDEDAYTIENDKINDFINNAKGVIPDSYIDKIMDRVKDATDDFIDENRKNKSAIKNIYDAAKEKVEMADGDPELQQEAVRMAKIQENKLFSAPTNVFGQMMRIVTESVHLIKPMTESYTNHTTNKIDFNKLQGDVEVLYTFMEALNTLGLVEANEQYIKDTLDNMRDSIENIDIVDTLDPAGEKKVPKEKDQNPNDDDDNNPSNDFITVSNSLG